MYCIKQQIYLTEPLRNAIALTAKLLRISDRDISKLSAGVLFQKRGGLDRFRSFFSGRLPVQYQLHERIVGNLIRSLLGQRHFSDNAVLQQVGLTDSLQPDFPWNPAPFAA